MSNNVISTDYLNYSDSSPEGANFPYTPNEDPISIVAMMQNSDIKDSKFFSNDIANEIDRITNATPISLSSSDYNDSTETQEQQLLDQNQRTQQNHHLITPPSSRIDQFQQFPSNPYESINVQTETNQTSNNTQHSQLSQEELTDILQKEEYALRQHQSQQNDPSFNKVNTFEEESDEMIIERALLDAHREHQSTFFPVISNMTEFGVDTEDDLLDLEDESEKLDDQPNSVVLSCFSFLKSNYVNLMNTYNNLIKRFNESEMERVKLASENSELKALLENSLKELNSLRSLERQKASSSSNFYSQRPKGVILIP